MLSIGKLATGQANYYLQQADRRINRATSVATGVEDYYLDGGEAAGEWIGSGLIDLGLKGEVDGVSLHRVLAGEHPAFGTLLRESRRVKVPGFDLTFSAPKSVSVLFGIADDEARGVIQRGHDAAVRDAMGYMERMAGVARRGHDGVEVIAGSGFVAAAFRHRTSRAGDPQLHTHVLVANLVRGTDGRWSALDGRRLYAHAKTAGYIYEVRLRAELTAQLGLDWLPVRNGIADVAGVPPAVLRAFSRRRAEIEAELARRGSASAAAAQAAALATRRAKDRLVDPRRLMPEWRERAAALGFGEVELREVFGRARTPKVDRETLQAVADRLASPTGLTQRVSSFSRRDVIRGWCEQLPVGAAVSSSELEGLGDAFLGSDRAVPLLGSGAPPPDALQRRDGGRPPMVRGELRYSTPELLALERRIVDAAVSGTRHRVGVAREEAVTAALARRSFLSGEQTRMVRRLTRDGGQIVAVVGKAGTGKTTALTAAREAWEASGLTVVGAAVARRAARELQDAAGIRSTSLAALLLELRRGGAYALPPGAVVVLDEASMVASRDLGDLVERVTEARGKLVLCGDHRQLPSIRAGGAFRAVAARTDAIELTENRRQEHQWEREALDQLRDGVASDAIRVYEANERLVIGGDRADVIERLVKDWWQARGTGRTAMIALRRADVRELNVRARELMRRAGELGEDVALAGGTFAPGDHVVLRRNDRRLRVSNGELGVVRSVDTSGTMTVRVGAGVIELPPWYVNARTKQPTVQLGYAITGHVAQGMTVDRAFVLGSPEIYREWGYTAMSRGRATNRMYVVAPDDLEREEIAPGDRALPTASESLARGLSTRRAQTAAVDTALEQRIRSASSAELRVRREALRATRLDPQLAEAVKAQESIAQELTSLQRAAHAAWHRVSELASQRQPLARRVARARHKALMSAAIDNQQGLEQAVAQARAAHEEQRATVARLRSSRVQQAGDNQLERQLVDDELARRASMERTVDIGEDAARRRSLR